MVDRPRLSSLSALAFMALAHVADNVSITFEELYDGLDNGTLLEDLARLGLDMSLMQASPEGSKVLGALVDAEAGMRGRERRKYGIDSNGLAMVVAYCLEALQQKYWV